MKKQSMLSLARASSLCVIVAVSIQACGGGGSGSSSPSPTATASPISTASPTPTPNPTATPTPSPTPVASNVVNINVNMRHEVGGISEFNRSKFITIHDSITGKDWGNGSSASFTATDATIRDDFFEDYDVYFGRNNGGMPWRLNLLQATSTNGRISLAQSEANGTQHKTTFYINQYNADTEALQKLEARAANMMQGGQPSMYPHNELSLSCTVSACDNTNEWLEGFDALADFYVSYLSDYFGEGGTTGEPKPKYIEVMNEPILGAAKHRTTPQGISDLHSVVAKRIKAVHPDVKVGGYTAAWPALEERNFATFDERWKVFIDTAGTDMDFYSIHIYDSYRSNKLAYRSGANSEAILDMLDQYSILEVGKRKPWVISEYGYFTPNSIERSSITSVGYSKELDWLNIRSFSSMMMGFLERPDQIVSAIPFHLNKALWYNSNNAGVDANGKRYSTRLFIMEEELSGEKNIEDDKGYNWVYSDIVKWYQLWSDVKGTRVDSASNEIDIQVDSYVDGNTLYIIVNNLELDEQEVAFDIAETAGLNITNIESKHLYWDNNTSGSILDTQNLALDTSTITIGAEATTILKVTYASDVTVDQSSSETKYYANSLNSFRKAITANQGLTFEINGVDSSAAEGEAILRVGVARSHNLSLAPTVSINGLSLNVSSDLRGYYENKARDDFFGIFEIPVPYSALQGDNDIVVSFPDTGGTVSTVTMQVFNMSSRAERSN